MLVTSFLTVSELPLRLPCMTDYVKTGLKDHWATTASSSLEAWMTDSSPLVTEAPFTTNIPTQHSLLLSLAAEGEREID
jgi:hypothetical protein